MFQHVLDNIHLNFNSNLSNGNLMTVLRDGFETNLNSFCISVLSALNGRQWFTHTQLTANSISILVGDLDKR